MKKRNLAILLSAAVLGLAGCSSGSSASAETETTSQKETESEETTEASQEETSQEETSQEAPAETAEEGVSETTEGGDTLTVNGGTEIPLSSLEYRTEGEGAPSVYFTSEITPEALMKAYEALEWTPAGNVAVKLSTGEPPASNYLAPELIEDLVQSVDGTIVECNTAYGGSRAETAMHYQVAEDHGFTAIADFQIQQN